MGNQSYTNYSLKDASINVPILPCLYSEKNPSPGNQVYHCHWVGKKRHCGCYSTLSLINKSKPLSTACPFTIAAVVRGEQDPKQRQCWALIAEQGQKTTSKLAQLGTGGDAPISCWEWCWSFSAPEAQLPLPAPLSFHSPLPSLVFPLKRDTAAAESVLFSQLPWWMPRKCRGQQQVLQPWYRVDRTSRWFSHPFPCVSLGKRKKSAHVGIN